LEDSTDEHLYVLGGYSLTIWFVKLWVKEFARMLNHVPGNTIVPNGYAARPGNTFLSFALGFVTRQLATLSHRIMEPARMLNWGSPSWHRSQARAASVGPQTPGYSLHLLLYVRVNARRWLR
jgi:hypothetical protein